MRWFGGAAGRHDALDRPFESLAFSLGIRYNGVRLMRENLSEFVPLSPATLHILLSLAAEDRHGYGIMQEVARQSDVQYKLGPGTLYDNLQRLMVQKLVQALGRRAEDDD